MQPKIPKLVPMLFAIALTAFASGADAATKISGNLVLPSPCTGCPIDALKKGLVKIRESKKGGTAGIEFQMSLYGATAAGIPAELSAFAKLELSVAGGPCQTFNGAEFPVAKGKGKTKFTAADLLLGGTSSADVALCGTIAVVDAATSIPFAVLGLRKGAGGPATFPCQAIGVILEGETSGDDAVLTWTVDLQSEVASYAIQRRGNDSGYTEIDTVPFAPNGLYEYTDDMAPAENNHYRLLVNCTDASMLIVPGEVQVDLTP